MWTNVMKVFRSSTYDRFLMSGFTNDHSHRTPWRDVKLYYQDIMDHKTRCKEHLESVSVQVFQWSCLQQLAGGGPVCRWRIAPSQLHQDLPWTMLQCSRELIGHRAELHHHAASAPLTRRSRWRFNPEVNSVTTDPASAETTTILHCFQIKGAVSVFLLQQCESCRELLTSHYTFTALTQLCLSL